MNDSEIMQILYKYKQISYNRDIYLKLNFEFPEF